MALTIDPQVRAELARYGFDDDQLARFAARLAAGRRQSNFVTGAITPITAGDVRVLPPPGTAERQRLHDRGLEAIRAGEVGVVILAGGMATRFGGVVKAAVPVLDERSFLDLKLADVRALGATVGRPIRAYVMTSYATHTRIEAQLAEEDLHGRGLEVRCFPQLVSIRLTPDGAPFTDAAGAVSPYATGHGDLTFALRGSGVLAAFRAGGGRMLCVSNVDNLGATLEPAVIGAHLEGGLPVTGEVVRKAPGDRGGAPARVDDVPQIVESFRFPPGFDEDAIPLFNVNSFVLDAAAIDRDFELTWFQVEKQVDGRPAVQFERLVGQLTAFLPTRFLEVGRDRFQPVKDPDELDQRRAAIREILTAKGVLATVA